MEDVAAVTFSVLVSVSVARVVALGKVDDPPGNGLQKLNFK